MSGRRRGAPPPGSVAAATHSLHRKVLEILTKRRSSQTNINSNKDSRSISRDRRDHNSKSSCGKWYREETQEATASMTPGSPTHVSGLGWSVYFPVNALI